jgi:hypothetical protein
MEPLYLQKARRRIQIEYIEMPDLKLTLTQVGRLCDVPRDVCEAAIASLVEAGFLWKAGDGSYLRRGLGRQADAILGT